MKLQDAYVSEANAIGDWTIIGYKMASNTNFTYSDPKTDYANNTSALTAGGAIGETWNAVNNVAMNDCGANSCTWKLSLTADSKGNGVKYTATAGDAMLTPSFNGIGK